MSQGRCFGVLRGNSIMEEAGKKRYTIDDVARELGISKTTVSRAISGKGRISQATREKVLARVERNDYRPNVVAQGLAQRRTCNIGLLLPTDYTDIDFPFFKECMSGICAKAAQHNYDIIISMIDGKDFTQLQRLIANCKVDGVIVTRVLANSSVRHYLKEKNVPFVAIGTPDVEEPGLVWIDNQNREGSHELTGILLMKGLRHLALLGGSRAHLVTQSRLQGYEDAHGDYRVHMDDSLIFMEMDSYAKVAKAADQILESGADGIVCMDDIITNMLLGCLRERRVEIPRDIRVASLYDSALLEYYIPAVTSLHFNTKSLGMNACQLLLEQLGEKVDGEFVPLNYQVILRESTK
ncbi:MAG: LacI family transcriptional regulator [Lachnospiraceae bacterium]|nr:LacI family transcriptional regulator [Lachnospiraceae bacterium]